MIKKTISSIVIDSYETKKWVYGTLHNSSSWKKIFPVKVSLAKRDIGSQINGIGNVSISCWLSLNDTRQGLYIAGHCMSNLRHVTRNRYISVLIT